MSDLKMPPPFGDTPESRASSLLMLQPGPPDKELADDYRRSLETAIGVLTGIMNEANRAGLQITFQVVRDQMGRNRLGDLVIYRPL